MIWVEIETTAGPARSTTSTTGVRRLGWAARQRNDAARSSGLNEPHPPRCLAACLLKSASEILRQPEPEPGVDEVRPGHVAEGDPAEEAAVVPAAAAHHRH